MFIGAFRKSFGSATRSIAVRPATVRTGVEIALGLALVGQTARLLLIVIDPGTASPDVQNAPPPPPADLTVFQRFDPFSRGLGGSVAEPATSGGYRLFGLRQGGPGGGSAIIGLADGRQVSVGVGEEIEPGVTLKAVGYESVTLSRGGADEGLAFAEVPVSAPVAVQGDPDPVVAAPPVPAPAAASEALLIDPSRLMAQASLRPRLQGARMKGLTVSARGDGAALRAAGLRSGDVILAVNDTELNSAQSLASLRGELTAAPSARIRFERNGREQTVTVRTAP